MAPNDDATPSSILQTEVFCLAWDPPEVLQAVEGLIVAARESIIQLIEVVRRAEGYISIEALNRPPAGSAATEVVAVAKDITAYRPRDLVAHLGYQVVIFMHKVNEDKQAPMVRIQGCA